MPACEKRNHFLKALRKTRHFPLVRHDLPGPEHIMSIFGASFWNLALEDYRFSLVDRELGSFDEVGKIGFEERKSGAVGCVRDANHRRSRRQFSEKALEQIEAVRVVR